MNTPLTWFNMAQAMGAVYCLDRDCSNVFESLTLNGTQLTWSYNVDEMPTTEQMISVREKKAVQLMEKVNRAQDGPPAHYAS